MTRKEILEFINKNPVCFLATQDSEQPRVRGMMVVKADEKGRRKGNFVQYRKAERPFQATNR